MNTIKRHRLMTIQTRCIVIIFFVLIFTCFIAIGEGFLPQAGDFLPPKISKENQDIFGKGAKSSLREWSEEELQQTKTISYELKIQQLIKENKSLTQQIEELSTQIASLEHEIKFYQVALGILGIGNILCIITIYQIKHVSQKS